MTSQLKNKDKEQAWYNKDISFGTAKFKNEQKATFYETLSTLINSGLELLQALEVAKEEQKKPALQNSIQNFIDEITQGATFYSCLQEHSDFTSYEAFSIQIAEETGKLGFILTQLAHYFENRVKQRRQIIGAMTYPVVIFSFSILAVFFMVTYVVPMFASVFQRFGGELPGITAFIINVSDFVQSNLLIIVSLLVGIVLGVKLLLKQENIKRAWHYTLVKLPVIGPLVKDSYLMRWCSAMYLMTSSNIPLTRSLEITSKMLEFYPLDEALLDAKLKIEKGDTLKNVLSTHPIFSKRIVSLIGIGEDVNKLEAMFLKLSENLEKEVEHKSKQLGTVIEPIIILFLGGIVAFILVAMYLPMFKLGDGIG
jgi:type IV pilus assembly protein PilC